MDSFIKKILISKCLERNTYFRGFLKWNQSNFVCIVTQMLKYLKSLWQIAMVSYWESEDPGFEPWRFQATFDPGFPKNPQMIPSQKQCSLMSRKIRKAYF